MTAVMKGPLFAGKVIQGCLGGEAIQKGKREGGGGSCWDGKSVRPLPSEMQIMSYRKWGFAK